MLNWDFLSFILLCLSVLYLLTFSSRLLYSWAAVSLSCSFLSKENCFIQVYCNSTQTTTYWKEFRFVYPTSTHLLTSLSHAGVAMKLLPISPYTLFSCVAPKTCFIFKDKLLYLCSRVTAMLVWFHLRTFVFCLFRHHKRQIRARMATNNIKRGKIAQDLFLRILASFLCSLLAPGSL